MPKGIRRPRFVRGMLTDTPIPPLSARSNMDIVARTTPLRRISLSYREVTDPIRLRGGGLLQPALLKSRQNEVAEIVEMEHTPRTPMILGTRDYETVIRAEQKKAVIPIGMIISSRDNPKISHLEVFYPNRGLRSEIVYDQLKKKGELRMNVLEPDAEKLERMGGKREPYTTLFGIPSTSVISAERNKMRIPLTITRADFEATNLTIEPPHQESGHIELPPREKVPVKKVPMEYAWERYIEQSAPTYVRYTTHGTENSHPHEIKRAYTKAPHERYVEPTEEVSVDVSDSRDMLPLFPRASSKGLVRYTDDTLKKHMDDADAETERHHYHTELKSPLTFEAEESRLKVARSPREAEAESQPYSGSEKEIDEELESLYGASEKEKKEKKE